MPLIKKYGEVLSQPLSSFGTFLVDNDPNSTYFRITEFKESFTGGKNGFLIEGTPYLKESTEIKIQILDVNGNPIYWEPGNGIPEYFEGTSKVVSVHIYDDTPIGDATITILGELKQYVAEGSVVRDIPEEWQGVYNLKWQKTFKVNKLLSNEDKVRFYRRPKVTIDELVKPLFSTTIPIITQTGSIDGTAIAPQSGDKLTDWNLPTFYRLSINDTTNWTGSVVGTRISIPELNYTPLVDSVITNKELFVSEPYTINGVVENIDNVGYTASFSYLEGVGNLKTALTGSFAKITLSDLTTFVGDVVSVDIYRKSQSKVGDYEFVQKVILESNEILKDYSTTDKNEENYGILSTDVLENYWVSSSNSTVVFDQTYLYNSAKISVPTGTGYFYTSQSFSINTGGEYTLDFNARVGAVSDSTNYIRAFISGSRISTLGNTTTAIGIEQNIITIYGSDTTFLQKTLSTTNFEADDISNPKLYFEVKGNNWYIADISLKASQETSFSPNEVTFVQSVPRSLVSETFDYRFKFYDINGNYIPVTVEASKLFDGGNIQRIEKKLNLNPTSLYFQFDSGSQPVPPTVITFNIEKTLLTGSVNFTSSSIDFFGNVLSASQYVGGVFPGTLNLTNPDVPILTVGNFTGSRSDIDVQLVTFTGECEGVTDTVTITAVLDGFGGVNHIIRPYRGTQIRNSSTQSLEIQAVRIDGINDIELYSGSRPDRGWNLIQLHVLSGSAPFEKFVNLQYASASGFIQGLTKGELGTKEINYNATFNRDSIDKRRTIYLISSASAASDWAFNTSASVLASQILEDLQDGLDTPVVTYNADTFTINFRNDLLFRPVSASATASFYIRGTNENPISASILVYPSMSINRDFVPEYWMYWVSQSKDSTISIVAADERGRDIPARLPAAFIGSPLSQSKVLTATFTYTEPYTLTQISVDKTFTIVPEGKPGDETIIFELTPSNLTLNANAKGIVSTYTPSNTQLKLKQGARYLAFSSSKEPGNFWLNYVTQSMISSGAVNLTETSSMLVTGISNMNELSASLTYDLLIHPYYTSSRYTQSLVQTFTKAVDGAPPIEIIINPQNSILSAFETGFIKTYSPASTSIQLKEGSDLLIYTSSLARGTWYFESITGSNIQTQSISSANSGTNLTIGNVAFTNFLPPHVSASAFYNLKVSPYSLLPGHRSGSVNLFATQSFTKNSDAVKARTVKLSTSTNTVNFDGDTVVISPIGDIEFSAQAINLTSSQAYYQWFKYDADSATYVDLGYGISTTDQIFIGSADATSAGETAVFRVELRDGHPTDIVRAVDEVTIFGVKAGADSFTANLTNENASIVAGLWDTTLSGSGTEIRAFKAGTPLVHTSSYVSSQVVYYEYGPNAGLPIGNLGYYSASIFSKSSHITLAATNRLLGNPATIGNLTLWTNPGTNTTAQVVYKVDFENGRKTQFFTQSLSVQVEGTNAYNVSLSNEASSLTYKVSGQLTKDGTGTTIKAIRGTTALTHSAFTNPATTNLYGQSGYKNEYRVKIYSKSAHITLAGSLTAGDDVPTVNNEAALGNIVDWTNPTTYKNAQIVYEIDCEGLVKFYKTQSFSLSFEGAVGPGIVYRGPWSGSLDYIGQVETSNYRRDAVTYNPYTADLRYYAAISGSGPNSTTGYGSTVGPQAPTGTTSDNDYWQYLGEQEFFVAAKIAIFEESYIKNTLNIGTKDETGAFANIVLAGGRNDPYMAMGQSGTIGLSGDQVSTGVLGYDKPGIFLGIYESPVPNGTTGRFSIRNADGSKALKWDGSNLYIVGGIRQTMPGVNEPSLKGNWTVATEYLNNDVVAFSGSSYICTSAVSHTSTWTTSTTTGYPPVGPWSTYIQSGSNGQNGATGPGVVYRGEWNSTTAYIYQSGTRRDVVKWPTSIGGDNAYYLSKLNSTNQLPSNTTYWEPFGAQFSSVATDVLLAQDATITRGLVMGTEGTGSGFIRSANATTILNGQGFYLDVNGRMRIGQQVSGSNKYVYFDGTDLNINATVNAPDGNIGGFTIANNKLAASGSLLVFDTQVPQIEIYKRGDTSGPKVVFNSNNNLTDPSAGTTYVSESTWTGTTTAQSSGTTQFVDTYLIFYNGGGLGVTTNGSGDPQTLQSLGEGATEFSVYVPQTSLSITAGTITTTTSAPPNPPNNPSDVYYSSTAYPRSAEGKWVVEVWDSAGTTKIASGDVQGTNHYRAGAYSYSYYISNGSGTSWMGPYTFSPGASYSGDITAGNYTGQIVIPAAGTYKVRLVYKLSVASGAVQDLLTNTFTYYGNTATPSHSETGFMNFLYFYFKPNFNKTEITNGGLQVISNQEAFFKVNRIEPSSYGYGSYILQSKGGIHDLTGGGASLFDKWNASCLAVYGKMYGVGNLEIGGGTTNITDTNMFKVNGGTAYDSKFQTNVVPTSDNQFTLGRSGARWTQVWAATGTIQTSDERQKYEIQSSSLGLDFINKLNPVSYKYISGSGIYEYDDVKYITKKIKEEIVSEDGYVIEPAEYKEVPNPEIEKLVGWNPGVRKHYGLVAQQVKNVLDECNISTNDFAGYIEGDLETHSDLGLRYEQFIAPMIKAIQELSDKVNRLEAQVSGSNV